jgi:hypothetical protein
MKFDNVVMTLEVIFRLNMSTDSQQCEDVFRFGAGLQNMVRFLYDLTKPLYESRAAFLLGRLIRDNTTTNSQ